jgi:hypothetical protein
VKQVAGWICLAEIVDEDQPRLIPYGAEVNFPDGYESLMENGLVPFSTQSEALRAAMRIRSASSVAATSTFHVSMEVGMTDHEQRDLNTANCEYVVVAIGEAGGIVVCDLYGPSPENTGQARTIPGEYMHLNGFKPFKDWEDARRCQMEVARQAQCVSLLARFAISGAEPGDADADFRE